MTPRQRQKRFRDGIKTILLAIFVCLLFVASYKATELFDKTMAKTMSIDKECYLIFPVEDYDIETQIICVYINGDYYEYLIDDGPESKIQFVCFHCPDQDDAETYEVVALY